MSGIRGARCRHSTSWLIAGGAIEWCYGCGAVRFMRKLGPTTCEPRTTWCAPTGGRNPHDEWEKRNVRWRAARASPESEVPTRTTEGSEP